MDTIPEEEVCRLRYVMRALAALSAGVHCALCVYSLVKAVQAPPGQRFALYLPRVGFAPDASMADDLTRAHTRTCAAANASATAGVLVLRNGALEQSWLPQPAGAAVDGFALLAALFLVSFLAQAFQTYTTFRELALETFRQPCLLRALEYAATAPLHVALVAVCVLVRDAHTLALLAAAQAACVLLAFALEFALGAADLEDPLERTILARSPPSLAVPCELRIGTLVCGPSLDERYVLTHEARAARAFRVCLAAALGLHAAVWAVLLAQLAAVEAAACAPPGGHAWLAKLRTLVATQCALLSSFALVPLLQAAWLWAGHADAATAFLYGSVAHAVLALVAKAELAAAYVAFVELFPFA